MIRKTSKQAQQSNVQFSVEQTATLLVACKIGEANAIEELQLNKIAFPVAKLSVVATILDSVGLRFASRGAGKTDHWMLDAGLGVASGTVVAKDYTTRRESTIKGLAMFDSL